VLRGASSRVAEAIDDPELYQGLPRSTEARSLAIKSLDDPRGKVDIEAPQWSGLSRSIRVFDLLLANGDRPRMESSLTDR